MSDKIINAAVKRFDAVLDGCEGDEMCIMEEDNKFGEYVKYDDYAKLEKQLEESVKKHNQHMAQYLQLTIKNKELEKALLPFAQFACDPLGSCATIECLNCKAKRILEAGA